MTHEEIFREEARAALSAIDSGKLQGIAELQHKILLTPAEVASLYGFTPRQLQEWRAQGKGPRYVSGEGRTSPIRYRRVDVEEYVSRRVVKTYDCQ
jgi:hypothetical protein